MSNPVYITRTSSFLPLDPVDNDTMESVLGMACDKPSRTRKITLRSNGIKTRHYAIDPKTGEVRYTNAQLTAEAIRALTDDTFGLNDISCIATGTSMPDQTMPNHDDL